MKLDLTDNIVVITGAHAGIGLAAVKLFLQERAKVIGGSRSIQTLEGLDLEGSHDSGGTSAHHQTNELWKFGRT